MSSSKYPQYQECLYLSPGCISYKYLVLFSGWSRVYYKVIKWHVQIYVVSNNSAECGSLFNNF